MSWQDVTLVLSSMSFELRSAWLILNTIQSNRALYSDLAMEFRTVTAWKRKEKKGGWKQFLLCTKVGFASQAPVSNVHISPLPKLLSTILIYAAYTNSPDAIRGHEMCSPTLAWFPLVHSSGWCTRSHHKSHHWQQTEKKKIYIYMKIAFNFTKILAEFIWGEGKRRVDIAQQQ